ncbi:MAG: family 10 glycosylhydrolase [Oscillospiraceae bacterium]|nr:family 10 glycosylhydrolase [Oscillospiraceae bacterium]
MRFISIIVCFFIILSLFCGCSDLGAGSVFYSRKGINIDNVNITSARSETVKMRAMWFSYLDFNSLLKNKSETEFKAQINTAFDNCLSIGCNTVIVQVRPFSDALYPSKIFPWSEIISGVQGTDPQFDPLAIMVFAAHERNMSIHAWINPFRVSNTPDISRLCDTNPALKWLGNGENVVVLADSIFYNPASRDVRTLIIDGITEIITNYDVDGIHFDDYFYPDPDESFDDGFYSEYLSSVSSAPLSISDWRRENINIFIKEVYSAIKSIDPDVLFGISPQGNSFNNYNRQYIDVPFILSHSGYVDYIAPQIYFGINHSSKPFAATLKKFSDMITVDGISLYAGLAAYKIGTEDKYAGNGKNEWLENNDILFKQMIITDNFDFCDGFIIFRYNSLFLPASDKLQAVANELDNIKKSFE